MTVLLIAPCMHIGLFYNLCLCSGLEGPDSLTPTSWLPCKLAVI